jgi:hypothetical protein
MMDKLRRALSGNDAEDEERGFVAQVKINDENMLPRVTIFVAFGNDSTGY